MEIKDIKFIDDILDRISQFGNGELEFETRDIERLCRLALPPRDPSIPRRNYIPDWCRAEKAIYEASIEIEKMGADVKLTDAVIKLSEAKNLVADYIDGI